MRNRFRNNRRKNNRNRNRNGNRHRNGNKKVVSSEENFDQYEDKSIPLGVINPKLVKNTSNSKKIRPMGVHKTIGCSPYMVFYGQV